jgi:tetratricopeptide (TPR) repeat protein/CHAT domain-containing protein
MRVDAYLFAFILALLNSSSSLAQESKSWLGVELDVTRTEPEWNAPHGIKVGRVVPGSPADKAGLKSGNIILSIDGIVPDKSSDVLAVIAARRPEDKIGLRILSDGREQKLTVTLAELNRSIADYTKAIEIDPANAVTYGSRGYVYYVKQDFDLAIADYTKAIEIDPHDAWTYSNRAEAYRVKGDSDRAIADYTKAIEIDPTNALTYYNRGYAYYAKQDYDLAISDYTKVVEIDPTNTMSYNNRGYAYYSKKDYERSIADYSKAIEIDPTNVFAYGNRGYAYYYVKKDYDRSIADYTKAIEIEPTNALTYTNRGNAYDAKQDYDFAIADYTKAIEIAPTTASTYNARGHTYYIKADYDLSIADYTEAIEIDPANALTYSSRGYVYYAMQDYDRAIADYTKAIEIDPKQSLAYFNRGYTYAAKGEHDRAIADYDKAIEVDPKQALAYFNRGRSYKAKGEYDRAVAEYDRAIEIDPKNPLAYTNRGYAYEAKGDYDRARADFNRAAEIHRQLQQLKPTATQDLDPFDKQIQALFNEGKYADAVSRQRALVADIEKSEKASIGNPGVQTSDALGRLAWYALFAKDFDEALAAAERALALAPDRFWIETNHAHALLFSGHVDEARALYTAHKGKRLHRNDYETWEEVVAGDFEALQRAGLDHAGFGEIIAALGINNVVSRADLTTLNKQVRQLYKAAKYAEALPIAERYVAATKKRYGEEHTAYATATDWLANLLQDTNRLAEAEPHYRRALAIYEKNFGTDDPAVAKVLNNLALLLKDTNRREEAETLYKRSLAIYEKALGPDHSEVGSTLHNLAQLYRVQGRYADAEPLYKRAIGINEKVLGADHPDVGQGLDDLAQLYKTQGRYAEAEPLYERSLAIREKALGPEHTDVADTLNDLAAVYYEQGRYAEGEPLFERSLAIREKALGPEHTDVAETLNGLAAIYYEQGRYAEAEPLLKRSVAIYEKARGPDDLETANPINSLAALYYGQNRYAEAEPLFKRALAINEKALGPNHATVATNLNNLAALYMFQDRYAEAESLFKRAVAIVEKASQPYLGISLNNLANLHFRQRHWVKATDYWRQSTKLTIRQSKRGMNKLGQVPTGYVTSEVERYASQFSFLVKALHRLAANYPEQANNITREAFLTAQWAASSTAAASAIEQMALRGSRADLGLSKLVRERQDLVWEWQARDKVLIAAHGESTARRNTETEDSLSARLAVIESRIVEIDKILVKDFPDYAALASPTPLTVAQVQNQLRPDEALVLFLVTPAFKPAPEESFIWVVTKTDLRWMRIELGASGLTERITALICGLDRAAWNGDGVRQCANVLGIAIKKAPREDEPLPFDLTRAHDLYSALFGQIDNVVRDKHLLIVPSGALTRLPFNVLVTRKPDPAATGTKGFRNAMWLAKRNAISVLPAVISLQALRQNMRTSRATKPFIGFGNPLLNGPDSRYEALARTARERENCGIAVESRLPGLSPRVGSVKPPRQRSGLSDVAEIRALPPLPETADELCAVARNLGVPTDDVYLGNRATERELKSLNDSGQLSTYRIVHFATHGALADEVKAGAEPGLILTPPDKATFEDDGFLSLSEIFYRLKLDADWVILSACNTAAGNAQGAEALSGLARAFFYAGTRALLVSHWSVDSDAAVKLITSTLGTLAADKSIGRSEALRRSMFAMIERGKPHETHPAYWAPFMVVGEGSPEPGTLTTSSVISGPPTQRVSKPKPRPVKKAAPADWKMEILRR